MSFLVKSPQLPTAATDGTSQVSSYRESETVPLGFGRDKYVSHWVCQPYDWKTRPTKANQPDMQICSIAAEYCAGPMGFIGKIWANGKEQANVDFTFADHGDPESMEFSLPTLGAACRAIVHRGTEDAPASIVANLRAKTAQNHPPMRGKCWIEWIDLDLGAGTTALPDLQVELGRATPAIGGFGVSLFGYHGVNPFAAIYWLLRDQAGFAVEAGFFDDTHWAAQCAALEAIGIASRTGQLTFCNPTFKNAQDAATLLSTILAHVDGYLYVDDGKFKIGWFPSQAPDMTGMPEITEADLEAVPDAGDWPDWNKGAASVVVVYRDFLRDYNDTPALCPAPANRETGFVSNPARNERPMIHDGDQAALIAAEISTSRASESTITLPVSKSRAVKGDGTPLMPGDLFNWDYGPHALDLVVRVIARRMRSAQTSDMLEIIPERGQFPRPYVAPVDDRVLPTSAAPGIINVADVRLYLLPKGFGALRQIAPLVNRAHRGIYRADLHFSPTGAAPWEDILDSRCFAAKVAVTNGGVTNVAATGRVISTSVDFARMAAQSAVSQVDDSLLLLVDNELMSVGAITTVATNTYDLAILRGRKGTTAAAHADAAVGFLFYREEIAAVEHVDFYRVRDGTNTYDAGIATKHFKLQLFTIDEEGLAKPDDPGISLVLPDLSPDETLGYTITISNEAHTVGCDPTGTVNAGELGATGTAKTTVTVKRGGVSLTAVAAGPNSDQFSIALGALTNTTATKETNDTVRCDSLTADNGTIAIVVSVAGAFTLTKIFTLTKVKTGATGGTGAPGGTGATGSTGNTVERRYMRSTVVPGTPFGDNPIGWTTAIPSGSDALWASEAVKDPAGHIVGSWSTPQRLNGNVVFYTAGNPASVLSGYALVEGDLAFDTSDGNRPYRWENPGAGYAWVAKPFGDAAIANLAAGKITAGTIQAAISIGTLGSLTAGSGYGQFYVDTTQMKHGAMSVAQFPSLSGTQLDIVAGAHEATVYAHTGGAAIFTQNNSTGKQAIMFDTGLIRGNSMESGADGFTSNGVATFNATMYGGIGYFSGDLHVAGSLYPSLIDGASGGYSVGLNDGNGYGLLKFKYNSSLDLPVIKVGTTDFVLMRAGAFVGSTLTHDGYVELKLADGSTRKFMTGS